jgi:two-component system response regulator RegX3
MTVLAPRGRVLLVEDEEEIGRLVETYLDQDGWTVVWARSGEDALQVLARGSVRIVVLDVGLPGMDGFDVCRRIRARWPVPVLMLTARDEETDRVLGLELGADDYVTKPFSPRELVARIRAILRRAEPDGEVELELGDVAIDRDAREVRVAGEPVELTGREFELLAFFLEHRGLVLSRERLLEAVWDLTYPGGTRTVDVHVGLLRRKLGRPALIRTVRGAGYKAVEPA